MIRWLVLVVILLQTTAACSADQLPAQESPRMGMAVIRDSGVIEVTYIVVKPVWETRTREIPYVVHREVGGTIVPEQRVRTETFQVCREVPESRSVNRKAGDFWVHRDGRLLDAADAAQLLREPKPVVFAELPKVQSPLDDFYEQFFKRGTVMVGLKAQMNNFGPMLPPIAPTPAPVAPPAPRRPAGGGSAPAPPAPPPAPPAPTAVEMSASGV